ncbi:hypothetical protein [Plantibacter sp. YIM 135249]|uniref:hypothetical protein n=1 Tax=Plantibacter sp. YIM 135249 TaxID=3423918 RepID=UPI003D334856
MAPTAAPTKSATSTPVAAAEPTAPVNSFGVDCENLVPQEVVASALSSSATAVPPFTQRADDSPQAWATTSVGGLNCWWSNGVPLDGWNQDADGSGRWAALTVLPGARSAWDAAQERSGAEPELTCFAGDGRTRNVCSIDVLIGDSWAYLLMQGVGDNEPTSDAEAVEAATPFLDAIRAALLPTASSPRYDWEGTVPGDASLPASCEDYVPASELSSLFGVELGYSSVPHKGLWPRGVAIADFGVAECLFAHPDSDNTAGLMAVLPGGRWAYERLFEAKMKTHASIEELDIDGLGAKSAFVECVELPIRSCTAQVAVAGHWLSVTASNPSSEENDGTAEQLSERAAAYAKRAVVSLLG